MSDKKLPLLVILLLEFFVKYTTSQDSLQFYVNTKKIVAQTSEKFLSFTFDPAALLTGDVLTSSTERSTNMAKALAPAYVRIAGPKSNVFIFERSLFPQNGYENPDVTFSEAHWVLVQQWAQRSGLEVISCLAPQRTENADHVVTWDSGNTLELISFSDHMGYNISWQLGYECQSRCDVSGYDLGKDISRLRNMLGAFPRYTNSIIAGPDFVSIRGKEQSQYIQDYLNAAGNSLSVITWHPDFAGVALDSDGVVLQTDTLASDKDLLFKAMGRAVTKKPIWIAESKPEQCKQQFLGALVWARRLGSAAKLGIQVIMRQPDATKILQPTPDYWVSVLHKMLVGREVLDAKLTSGNKTHVHFFCQCTKSSEKYDKGAVTIFGINLTPGKVSVSLKGFKIKALHKYILMPGYDADNRMFAETVLLNNEPLNLVDEDNLPEIKPAVSLMGKNMAVKLPSGGIGFWVIPGARVKACMTHDDEAGENSLLKKLTKKLEEPEVADENEAKEDEQSTEFESVEDIKSILKSKGKKKRKFRHSDETDDEERKFKKIDTKKEFEKFEKFLKRNHNYEQDRKTRLKGRTGLVMLDDESNDTVEDKKLNSDSSEENGALVQLKNENTVDSTEKIRSKIEEYKNKLIKYENKQKFNDEYEQLEKSRRFSSWRNSPQHEDVKSLANDVDTQKAIEALALISKVEEEIKRYGEPGESINQEIIANANENPVDKIASDIGEEILLEELKRSDKAKRMIDPKILGGLFKYFVGKNPQQSAVNPRGEIPRVKRDLEKLFGDDPLGLRKDGLFKKRLKNDEAKERRLERRNRKKDREVIGLKKELPIPKLSDSDENNFYGFPEMKPIENFPKGDVFLAEGTSSEEKSGDYDYVQDDDDDEIDTKKKSKLGKQRLKSNNKNEHSELSAMNDDNTWIEEPNSNLQYAPNEFFERINRPPVTIKSQWKDYGELYEPESLIQKVQTEEQQKTHENDAPIDAVIEKERPDERADKQAKETAVKKLMHYYDKTDVKIVPSLDREQPRKKAKNKKSSLANTSQNNQEIFKSEELEGHNIDHRILDLGNDSEEEEELGSMEFVNSKEDDYSEESYEEIVKEDAEVGAKRRPKRRIPNLNHDVFGPEMIREDAGNMRDCKCRVIRKTGKVDCKNCRKKQRRARDLTDQMTIEYPAENFYPETSPTVPTTTDQPTINNPEENERVEGNETNEKITMMTSSSPEAADITEPIDSNTESPGTTPNSITDFDFPVSENTNFEEPVQGLKPEKLEPQIVGSIQTVESSDVSSGIINAEETDVAEAPKEKDEIRVPERENLDQRSEKSVVKIVDIIEDDSREKGSESNNTKRHIPGSPEAESESQSSTKFSLSSGLKVGTSAKVAGTSEAKLKEKSDFKLKTEALSALIKENESRKADVLKAFESSSKLKSIDNSKYLEFQRKRADKLVILKEKLRDRKAKILQQYRQELLDALSKCDTEVERNLKRREIWDNFTQEDEFQDFVDKDKLAYFMMHRPVNYDESKHKHYERIEDRRYSPQVALIQSIKEPRERKIVASNDPRSFIYAPKTSRISSASEESFESSAENSREERYQHDEPYYAIVESLENPKILHLDDLRADDSTEVDEERIPNNVPERYHIPEYDYETDYSRYSKDDNSLPHKLPKKFVAIETSSYKNGKPEIKILENLESTENTALNYGSNIEKIRSLIPAHPEEISHHKQFQKFRNLKEFEPFVDNREIQDHPQKIVFNVGEKDDDSEEFYGTEIVEIPIENGLRILQKLQSSSENCQCCENTKREKLARELDESQGYRQDYHSRRGRHLIPQDKETINIPEYEITPAIRRERDVKRRETRSNYICVKEDSTEDSGIVDNRIFKLIKRNDHFEAVPIMEFPVENSGTGRERKLLRRVSRHNEKAKIKRKKHSTEAQRENSDDYDVLMLMPVKTQKSRRLRRDLNNNNIDRSENSDEINKVWDDIIDVKEGEKRVQDYIDAKEKPEKDFKAAQSTLNEYLMHVEDKLDPQKIDKFEKVILNLGSTDQDTTSVTEQTQYDGDEAIHLREYLNKEVSKKLSTTEVPPEPIATTPSIFDLAMPKFEKTINDGIEKVGNLSESLEEFIGDFNTSFNDTSEIKDKEFKTDSDQTKEQNISHNIFHSALHKVKRFFDFLHGISLIFNRY